MKTNQQNKEWEEEFDKKFPYAMEKRGWLFFKDELKQFIHTTRQEAYEEGKKDGQKDFVGHECIDGEECCQRMEYEGVDMYDSHLKQEIDKAKQQARDEIVEMIEGVSEDECSTEDCTGGYDDHEYAYVLGRREFKNDIINKIKEL